MAGATDLPKRNNKGGQPGNKNAEKWTEKEAIKFGNELIEWLSKENTNIFYRRFCHQRNLYHTAIAYLCDKFNSFSNIIKKAKEMQEYKINDLAIRGKLNTAYSCFFMKNKHSYKDRTDITTNDESLTSVTLKLVDGSKDE
jgi:hypothetical protein